MSILMEYPSALQIRILNRYTIHSIYLFTLLFFPEYQVMIDTIT
jgi:hypothetical protein